MNTTKITKFADIPKFTRTSNYVIHIDISYLAETLAHYASHWPDNPDNYQLDPDFQRGHVWTQDKQIAFVEYLLRGGKSSRDIYFNCPGWMYNFDGPMQLVDGKQRIEAALAFLRGDFKVFGSYYSEFTDRIRMANAHFIFHVNDLKTRAEVLQWYLDLNSGGMMHTDDELNKVKVMLVEEQKSNNIQ